MSTIVHKIIYTCIDNGIGIGIGTGKYGYISRR